MTDLKDNPLELGGSFKQMLLIIAKYGLTLVLGIALGQLPVGEDELKRPAAVQQIEELPERVIVVEQTPEYKILLDQATGVQFLWRRSGGVVVIPGTPAKQESLEGILKNAYGL